MDPEPLILTREPQAWLYSPRPLPASPALPWRGNSTVWLHPAQAGSLPGLRSFQELRGGELCPEDLGGLPWSLCRASFGHRVSADDQAEAGLRPGWILIPEPLSLWKELRTEIHTGGLGDLFRASEGPRPPEPRLRQKHSMVKGCMSVKAPSAAYCHSCPTGDKTRVLTINSVPWKPLSLNNPASTLCVL